MTAAVPIGDCVEPVLTWNPARAQKDGTFTYVDLSSIDPDTKVISAARRLANAEAPSRARQLLKAGDVLVSTVRPNLNGVAKVQSELAGAIASTGFCVLRPRTGVLDADYLFHWVRSARFIGMMVREATGASYPAVSARTVLTSPIELPNTIEQRRIAGILDRADTIQGHCRAAAAQLDTLSEALFLETFGDPVANPKGWPRAHLGDVVLSVSDGPHVSPTYADDGVPFLSTRHVRPGEVTWDDLKFISRRDAQTYWRRCKPQPGDVLYTKGGTTGLAAMVTTDRPFAVWVHLAVLRPDLGKVDPLWLESMLNSRYCYRQSQALTHGIANHDLGLTRMTKIAIILPSLADQKAFATRLQALRDLRAKRQAAASQAEALIASLQHRAFTGQL